MSSTETDVVARSATEEVIRARGAKSFGSSFLGPRIARRGDELGPECVQLSLSREMRIGDGILGPTVHYRMVLHKCQLQEESTRRM